MPLPRKATHLEDGELFPTFLARLRARDTRTAYCKNSRYGRQMRYENTLNMQHFSMFRFASTF
jgi:hypothetical protein